MTIDLLSLSLRHDLDVPVRVDPVVVRPLSSGDVDSIARIYLDSYPPAVGASDFSTALDEIKTTLAGEYGQLRTDASFVAELGGSPIGAIFTTTSSIWDPDLSGPFIIDLFVGPNHRQSGAGRALLIESIKACVANKDTALSLRIGNGTSPHAHSLYKRLGFVPIPSHSS